MDFITGVLSNYGNFFSLHEIVKELADPKSWGIIATLMLLEGLLSADNALVLAMMVKHLPEKEQKKALTYGIWGAYFFRFLAIGLGTWLIKIWWVKLVGAAYLLYMVFDYFKGHDKNKDGVNDAVQKGFWATIVSVELMDIAFSVDSIVAALGVSSKVWVLFLGAVFGILMMRGVAKIFVTLLNKIPELETGAYLLIALIGIRMALEVIHIEIPDFIFFGALILTFGGTIAVHYMKANMAKDKNNNLSA